MTAGEFGDDPTIGDGVILWRRVPSWNWIYDVNQGRFRPKSTAFDDHPDGSPMSVVIAVETAGPEAVMAGHDGFALAAITVGSARACNQGVARDPLPGNAAHAVVVGRKTESVRRRLARGATWVVPPPASPPS